MSLDLTNNAAYIEKKKEIAQIVLSRKRKLTELYSLATSTDPVPKLRLHLDEPHTSALALFLEQNNLEKGHYFQNASLPPRPRHGSDRFKTRHPPLSQSTSTTDTLSNRADRASKVAATPDAPNVESSVTAINQDAIGLPRINAVQVPHDVARKAAKDSDISKTPMRLSGVVVEQHRPVISRAHSPRLTVQPERPPSRPAIAKPSRPESPPYSPESELRRIDRAALDDGPPSGVLDNNVLTPRRDDQDTIPSSAKGSNQDHFESADESYDTHRRPDDDEKKSPHATELNVPSIDRASSTSPTSTSRSAHTARTNAHSPATSPDDDVARPQPGEISSELLLGIDTAHPVDDASIGQKLQQTFEAKSSVEQHGTPKLQYVVSTPPRLSVPATKPSAEVSPSVDVVMQDAPTSDVHSIQDSSLKPSIAESIVLERSPSPHKRKAPSLPASPIPKISHAVTEPSSVKISPTLRRPLAQRDNRVNKRRIINKDRKVRVILSRPSDERYLELVRNIRKDQSYIDEDPLSYLRASIQSQALADENIPPLDQLLMGTSKSVTTSDFMTSIREEQDVRVIERARHLQATQRWSYRQPKASPEPTYGESHWDVLLKDVKWLRNDYREERKLQTATAGTLASWCADWVAAGPTERAALQVRVRSRPTYLLDPRASELHSPTLAESAQQILHNGKFGSHETDDEAILENLFRSPRVSATTKVRLDESFLANLPVYGAFKPQIPSTIRAFREVIESEDHGRKYMHDNISRTDPNPAKAEETDDTEAPLPPEEINCALFNPEARPLRARLNAPWIFKPPTASMPPQAFYEYRSASQWNWEDDQLLKQYTKDFPSNWPLIADRMAPKSSFNSYTERRTPWECYERLLATDGPPADAQARQYLRHFSYRIEKARESFDKHQAAIREQQETHARSANQPVPPLPQKRFPTPIRVDRKPNKRVLALLDGSRKLARKREQNAAKQQNQPQQDSQAQKPNPARLQPIQTPQYFSRLKYETECKEAERVQASRDQQRALYEQSRRQQAGQANLTNGTGQQARNRVASGQAVLNGQPTAPGTNQAQPRPTSQHPSLPIGLPNGVPQNTQIPLPGRTQASMSGQQRIAPQLNGQPANQELMSRMAQQMQQRTLHQMQQNATPQASVPNQFARGSPSIPTNGAQNAMIAAFNSAANASHNHSIHEGMSTPGLAQQMQHNTPTRSSPHISQQLPAQMQQQQQQQQQQNHNQPQSLSSGHVPPIVTLSHQIRMQHPTMSAEDVQRIASQQLKNMVTMSRQNAINAATGAHPQSHQTPRVPGGQQSPFPAGHQQQLANSHQMQQQQQQLLQQQQQQQQAQQQQQQQQQQLSPYQQNGIMSTSGNQGGVNLSPNNVAASLAVSPQLQHQQQPQNMYSQQLRQQMFAQQRQHQIATAVNGSNGVSPPTQHVSPAMGMAMPVGFGGQMNRTPSGQGQGQSMRPPSRSNNSLGGTAGMGMDGVSFGGQMQGMQQRSQGQGQGQSPRPLSSQSQGYGGQG